MKVKYFLLLVILCCICISCASADSFNITSRRGESWIVWNWTIPSSYIDSGYFITVNIDGMIVNNVSLDTNLSIPYNYYLTGTHSNEEHTMQLGIYNGTIPYLSESSTVGTRQSSEFYYVTFIIGIGMLLISILSRNKIISVVLSLFALLMMVFISYVFIDYNSSFSNIGLICSVLSGFIIIYSLYEVYKENTDWKGGWK